MDVSLLSGMSAAGGESKSRSRGDNNRKYLLEMNDPDKNKLKIGRLQRSFDIKSSREMLHPSATLDI